MGKEKSNVPDLGMINKADVKAQLNVSDEILSDWAKIGLPFYKIKGVTMYSVGELISFLSMYKESKVEQYKPITAI